MLLKLTKDSLPYPAVRYNTMINMDILTCKAYVFTMINLNNIETSKDPLHEIYFSHTL
jgi:hypothetical protein